MTAGTHGAREEHGQGLGDGGWWGGGGGDAVSVLVR